MVLSIGDVRVVMEVVECLLHSEISVHKPLYQMLAAILIDRYCLCAINQVQTEEEDKLKYGCGGHFLLSS